MDKVPIDRDAGNFTDSLIEPPCQTAFMEADRVWSPGLQIVQGGPQAGDAVAVQRSCLQTGGPLLRLGLQKALYTGSPH